MRRRSLLAACGTALGTATGCLSVPERFRAGDPPGSGPAVALDPVLEGTGPDGGQPGPRFPTDLAVTDDGVRYVADLGGRVWRHGSEGSQSTPVLDVSDRVVTGGAEQGLVGLALHPDFAANGKLYLRYSGERRPGAPANWAHTAVLAEYRLDAERRGVRPGSGRTVLAVDEPRPTHNGGALAFGPEDGYLYASYGDGGWMELPRPDWPTGQARDWYEWVPGNNGQDVTENLHGSVLRLDVDGRDGDEGYAVPPDNPLVGEAGLDEHYAWGFRNPWRMGFSGDTLYVADVGESTTEEVNAVRKGHNYGWAVREGSTCLNPHNTGVPGPWCPTETPEGDPLVDPVIEYGHEVREAGEVRTLGTAVVGGYVYEGDAVPALAGDYVFGDYGGVLLAASPAAEKPWPVRRLAVEGGLPGTLLGVERDADGELLVLTAGRRGRVSRVVPGGG